MTSKKTYRIMHAVQTVAVIIISLAFLFLIGTCGSLECDVITFKQAIIRFIIGTLIALACTAVSKHLETVEEFRHRNDDCLQVRLAEHERRRQARWDAYFHS
jgi:hypothetical protein